jgi:iduronate 2-sulfatase
VPLLLLAPGRVPGGKVNHAVVDNTTIMPTLLELAGLPAPTGVQGKSVARLLRGGQQRQPQTQAQQRPAHGYCTS